MLNDSCSVDLALSIPCSRSIPSHAEAHDYQGEVPEQRQLRPMASRDGGEDCARLSC